MPLEYAAACGPANQNWKDGIMPPSKISHAPVKRGFLGEESAGRADSPHYGLLVQSHHRARKDNKSDAQLEREKARAEKWSKRK